MRAVAASLTIAIVFLFVACGSGKKTASVNGLQFDSNNPSNTADWMRSRGWLIEDCRGNPIRQKQEQDAYAADLQGLAGRRVSWPFRFRSLTPQPGGKLRLNNLNEPAHNPDFELKPGESYQPFTVHVVDYDRDASYELKKDANGITSNYPAVFGRGVTVPTSPDLESLKEGDVILINGTIRRVFGTLFVLDELRVSKMR